MCVCFVYHVFKVVNLNIKDSITIPCVCFFKNWTEFLLRSWVLYVDWHVLLNCITILLYFPFVSFGWWLHIPVLIAGWYWFKWPIVVGGLPHIPQVGNIEHYLLRPTGWHSFKEISLWSVCYKSSLTCWFKDLQSCIFILET